MIKKPSRMGLLDIFRIFSALMIVLYHSISDFGRSYGVITPFIQMGSIFMTAFFILSGFCLFFSSAKISLNEPKSLFVFYLKRFFAIFPLYYVIIAINLIGFAGDRLQDSLILLPIELLGLQMLFPGIVNNSLNGGLWFISCITICYIFFPFISILIRNMKIRYRLILLAIVIFTLLYSPFVQYRYDIVSLYHEPLYRFGEFIIGVLLASFLPELKKLKHEKILFNPISFTLCFALLITLVFVFYNNGIQFELRMYYELFTAPLFSLIILILGGIKCNPLDNSRVLKYIASICYALYLVQVPIGIPRAIVNIVNIENNILQILFIVAMYVVLAIALHEIIERPASLLKNKILNKIQ